MIYDNLFDTIKNSLEFPWFVEKPMQANSVAMKRIVKGLPSISAKIRALGTAGYACADIARFLDRRYQHVRNVLVQGPPKSESAQSRSAGPGESGNVPSKTLRIAENGRVVIPAEMRSAMRVDATGYLTARVVEGELRVLTPKTALSRAQKMVRGKITESVSLADELIAERRAEAQRETEK